MIPDSYNGDDSDGLGAFLFDFEGQDMVSSTDQEYEIETQRLNMNLADQFASDTGLFAREQAPLPLRPHRSLPKSNDRSSPTISGCELLSLEGRSSPKARMATSSMPLMPFVTPSSAAPSLRRKGKFGPSVPNTLRSDGAQSASRLPNEGIDAVCQPSETPMSPSSYEWTRNFEQQISLQTNRAELLDLQMYNFQDVQRENTKTANGHIAPRDHFQHKKAYSEQSALSTSYSHMIDSSQQMSHSVPRDINFQVPILPDQSSNAYDASMQQSQRPPKPDAYRSTFQHHRQVQPWGQTPSGFTSDYTVSPSHVEPSWFDGISSDSTGYFPDVCHPASIVQAPGSLFSQEDIPYSPTLPLNNQTSFPNLPTDNVHFNSLSIRRPHTPPPSNPSASPTTPEAIPSTQKQTRASRRQNAGGLRLRKSTAALKPTKKSLSALKGSKSAGTLRGRKSIGVGLNHNNQGVNNKSPVKKESQQSTDFGFLNYTPEDSRMILTGVAPSGSSKTKARREAEATKERRRLSLAAIKAIEVAGGDSLALMQELKVEAEG